MIKKILPTMIGAALTVGMTAAAADVTVFGHIDTSIVSADADKGLVNTTGMPEFGDSWTGDNDRDDTNFKCTTCSIGFKGSEDLGNGLKAIFKLDFQYDTVDAKGSSFSDRDQWLGLAGVFGSVKVGTISTPYKSHGAMIDPLYRTAAQGRAVGLQSYLHNGAGENGQGRADNTARWDSPSWNGLKVAAYYTLDSAKSAQPDAINLNEDDDAYGAGISYQNGGILVFADYVTNNSDKPELAQPIVDPGLGFKGNNYGDLSAWKVGGKYTFNNFAIMGQYEDIDQDFGNSEEAKVFHVAGSYTMGNNMIYAGVGRSDFKNIEAPAASAFLTGPVLSPLLFDGDSEQTTFTLAGVHNLSKRTSVYLAYSHIEQDNDDILNLENALTIEPTFDTKDDPEADIFALGMKHKF